MSELAIQTPENQVVVTNKIETLAELSALALQNEEVSSYIENSTFKELFFPVKKIEVNNILPTHTTTSEYSHFVVGNFENETKTEIDGLTIIENDTENKILNCCSNRYELIKNSEIFPSIIAILFKNNILFKEKIEMNTDKTEFTIKFNILNRNITMQNGDIIKPQLMVTHSYNGKLNYSISFGFFRMVCSNGLSIPVKGFEHLNLTIKGKHTASIITSFKTLIEKTFLFFNNQNSFVEKFKQLEKKRVYSVEANIEKILDKVGIKNPANKVTTHILNRLDIEKEALNMKYVNMWLIYNAINHYIHNSNKKNIETRQKLDSKVLEFMLN